MLNIRYSPIQPNQLAKQAKPSFQASLECGDIGNKSADQLVKELETGIKEGKIKVQEPHIQDYHGDKIEHYSIYDPEKNNKATLKLYDNDYVHGYFWIKGNSIQRNANITLDKDDQVSESFVKTIKSAHKESSGSLPDYNE